MFLFDSLSIAEKVTSLTEHTESRLRADWLACVVEEVEH